jgi:HAD superfamily hydrolase (TIGR01549 family)
MSETPVEAWLVDLDGTLYTARWVKLAMAAELMLLGWAAISTLRRFRHEHERLRDHPGADTESPFSTQLARTAEGLGLDVSIVQRRVESWMVERPGKWIRMFRRTPLLHEIASFRERGGRTALVSDYPARRKLEALGSVELFDVVVANGEPNGPRRLKPDPDGYLRAARSLGIDPARCLVIGDRDDADGEAARAAQMQFRRV